MAVAGSNALRWSNILIFAAMIAVNGLAGSTALLGGKTTAEVSALNPTLITPAGYAFAIWGVIYLLLGAFVIYQALPGQRNARFNERIGWLFVASSVLNILWLFSWQYELLSVSVIIMFTLLATLILIYLRLDVGRAKVGWAERLAVHLPFSIYLGWITTASIANVAAVLVSIDWDAFGIAPEIWAVLMILFALIITVLMAIARKDAAYVAVMVWSLVAIGVNQSSYQTIFALALAGAAVAVIVLAASILQNSMGRWRRAAP